MGFHADFEYDLKNQKKTEEYGEIVEILESEHGSQKMDRYLYQNSIPTSPQPFCHISSFVLLLSRVLMENFCADRIHVVECIFLC